MQDIKNNDPAAMTLENAGPTLKSEARHTLSEMNRGFTLQELVQVCEVVLLLCGILVYGSVCSGIEAATVAWEPLGWELAWTSQYDPQHKYKGLPPAEWRGVSKPSKSGKWRPDFASRVLAHHYPHIRNLGDMSTIAERVLSGEVEAPGILVGGTPCQAFSVAGLRGGLTDSRGQLILAYVKLLDAIDFIRLARGLPPTVCLWENVFGVLSTKDNTFGCFLGALVGESEPLVPPDGKRWPGAGLVAGEKRSVVWRCLDSKHFGVPQRRKRIFLVASAGADVASLAEVLFEPQGEGRNSEAVGGAWKEASSYAESGARAIPLAQIVYENHGQDSRITECREVAPTVSAKFGTGGNNVPLVQTADIVRKLTPRECERLQGFQDDYTAIPGASDGPRYRALGNSMAVPVMRWIGERITRFAGGGLL